VFYVKKDTSPPVYTNNISGGDTTWRSASGTLYDIDFEDPSSLLDDIEYTVWSELGRTGIEHKTWTPIAENVNAQNYTENWPIDFSALQETATNYVSVRITDSLTQRTTANDVFFVLKDITKPTITDNQTGDFTWRQASGTQYNIDFDDTGGSKLDLLQYRVWSSAGQSGTEIISWTTISDEVDSNSYATDWQVDFSSLNEGVNYVTVRVYDYAGGQETLVDAFEVRKDTTAPSITDNQSGDTIWRKTNTATYNIDYDDTGGSQIDLFKVKASTTSGGSGSDLISWTDTQTSISADSYTTDWQIPESVWNVLHQDVTNYISVLVYDTAGSSTSLTDAFNILKDSTSPSITNNITGEPSWQNSDSNTYDIDYMIPAVH